MPTPPIVRPSTMAALCITTEPTGAKIILDQMLVGSSPFNINLVKGQYWLKLELEGYQDWIQEVIVDQDTQLEIVFPASMATTDSIEPETMEVFGIEMVWIPPQIAIMGSNAWDGRSNEHPQHQVSHKRGFWVGRYPVTQAQYESVVGTNPSCFSGHCHPVKNISWYDCKLFIENLNRTSGYLFRLPSESEWEIACRSGSTTHFLWGDGRPVEYAWFDANSDESTHPVGILEPNSWGLYDLSGNVWEWCEDHYHNSYHGAPVDGKSWVERDQNMPRVCRGGCWGSSLDVLRSAYRHKNPPEYKSPYLGFRLCI